MYDTINPYKFDNVTSVKTSNMSLFDIEKNESVIIVQKIIEQKHVLKRPIRKSYDTIFILRITRRGRQYVRPGKTNDQRYDTITRTRFKNSYTQLRTRSSLSLSFSRLLSSLLKPLSSLPLSYFFLPRSLFLSLFLISISLEFSYNVKKH